MDLSLGDIRHKETVESNKHVNTEDKDVLANIILTTHAMATDLYIFREVLQCARNKLLMWYV